MISNYVWMFFVILRCFPVSPRPTHSIYDTSKESTLQPGYNAQNVPKYGESLSPSDDQVISVRITSSVAVGKRKGRPSKNFDTQFSTDSFSERNFPKSTIFNNNFNTEVTNIPPSLEGANMEFIKQLNAKKDSKQNYIPNQSSVYPPNERTEVYDTSETKPVYEIDNSKELSIENSDIESLPTYHSLSDDAIINKNYNYTDSIAEPSLKSVQTYEINEKEDEEYIPIARSMPSSYSNDHYQRKEILLPDTEIEKNKRNNTRFHYKLENDKPIANITNHEDNNRNIPLGRSISIAPPPDNFFSNFNNKPVSESDNSDSLTTVSFNVVHNTPKQVNNFDQSAKTNLDSDNSKFYEPPTIYSQPAQIYSEPAKFYSEPAKIYSEPAKIYSEPAKIYSEPAKIYSEPAKFYSPPASLHLPPVPADYRPWQPHSPSPDVTSTSNTTPVTIGTRTDVPKKNQEHQPEKNYEVDEKASVLSEGRIHGVQESTTEKCKQDNCKVGYVVEGRQYKKYRVEERTSDGFIVGEYGVVRNEDGALRGVRYTADSDASPRLIYDALMKFLQLK